MLAKFAKKEKYKKGGSPPQKKYSIPIFSIQGADSIPKPVPSIPTFLKISSGARKEPAELIPPNKNKRNTNKIKATGEK